MFNGYDQTSLQSGLQKTASGYMSVALKGVPNFFTMGGPNYPSINGSRESHAALVANSTPP